MRGALLGKHEEELSVNKHAMESLATFKEEMIWVFDRSNFGKEACRLAPGVSAPRLTLLLSFRIWPLPVNGTDPLFLHASG